MSVKTGSETMGFSQKLFGEGSSEKERSYVKRKTSNHVLQFNRIKL